MTLLGLRLRRRPSIEQEPPEEEPQPVEPVVPSGPPLVLLVPTVAGVGCFQCFTFPDADSASAFAEENFTSFQRSNIYAFWAFQQKPPAGPDGNQEHRGEVLVLIREAEESQVVYAVSFVDFDAADAFIRFEANRGLNLSLVSMYWALLITIEETGRGVHLTPHLPPQPRAHHPRPAAHRESAHPFHVTLTAPEPEPEAPPLVQLRSEVQAEVEAVLEAYRREEAAGAGLLLEDEPVAEEAPPEEEIPETVDFTVARAEWPAIAPVREAVPEFENEPPATGQHDWTAENPVVIEQVVADERRPAVDAKYMAPEEVSEEDAGAEESGPDLFDVALEAAKTLRLRRWEKREEPFHGFNSPPGRF